jgi:DNA polymerase III alpha subunit
MSTNNVEQLFQGVIRHGPGIISKCLCDDPELESYLKRVDSERLDYPIPPKEIDPTYWSIPKEYQDLDIENWILNQCKDEIAYRRAERELVLYRQNNMITVLKAMKYIVDTLRANNVVWGVGRGSSVASYVLHVIGVHKIDSIKYDLPIEEFFKEKQHG